MTSSESEACRLSRGANPNTPHSVPANEFEVGPGYGKIFILKQSNMGGRIRVDNWSSTMQIALIFKGLLLGLCAAIIDYLFIGVAFHRYQAHTPQTWRPEGPRSYAAATVVDFLFGIGMAFFSRRTELR